MRRLVVLSLIAAPALAAEDPRAPAAPVAAAERAFAKRCGEVGIRASFVEYFAPEAVSFEPEPGNFHERAKKRPPPKERPPILLEWGPEQAEMAPGGDMGWTTGPSLFTDKSPANRPPIHGYYFSVWKKQPDGSLKVVLDLGVDTATAKPVPMTADLLPSARVDKAAGGPDAVRKRDEDFCKAAQAGAGKAYAEALAPNGRVHRWGIDPAIGERAQAWAKSLAGGVTCKTMAAFASNPAALGYTYGSYARREKADGPAVEKGFYARVWRWDNGWKIAADVVTIER